ncbi:MAG: VWA domain-containing protein, partial [Chloroflexota bacterium]|nr:VWA domain-containing protein [Chloroflexota bacterium]
LEAVTAGVTDDNEQFNEYLDYRTRHAGLWVNDRDISERYVLRVLDENSLPVHDATVEIYADEQLVFEGRTDAGGQLLFHLRALDNAFAWADEYRVVANKGYVAQSQTFARNGGDQWLLTLTNPARPDYTQLDLLFLLDATGSMDDEIDKLKASIADVADQIATLPQKPDVRYGLVAYRDRGDEYVVRPHDFTYNLEDFQANLAAVYAGGGGDTPEALGEALHRSLNDLSWRDEETVRLIILVADAPPHLDYNESFSYDTDMIEMVRRGIKLFPVGASNLDETGEYVFRQLAQFTGGKFVFLTYAEGGDPSSGAGTETDHDVDNYSVDTLDRLVVRLVRDELEKLSSVVTVAQPVAQQQPSALPTATPLPPVQPFTCTVDLTTGRNDCAMAGLITEIEQAEGALFRLTLDPRRSGYVRVRFDITLTKDAGGLDVNIGDSISNDGYSGDSGDQSNYAEVQIEDGTLRVYGNDYTPAGDTTDSHRLLRTLPDVVRGGDTISLEVANEHLGINALGGIEVLDSPYLFALDGQADREGSTNYDLYAAFNRTVDGSSNGRGVSQVVITLYPVR